MSILLAVIFGLVVLVLAVIAIYHENLKISVIASGVIGLFASVLYLLLAAPDVGMTEASIGRGLTTIVFFYVLNKVKKSQ